MIACTIKDIKQFMHILLNTETFDKFSLEEGRIVTSYTTQLDGRTISEYYDGDENRPEHLPEFISWQQIRPMIFDLIKGRHTPVSFQFTLHADTGYMNRLIEKNELSVDISTVKCLLVNIRFEHGKLMCITGTAFTTFVMDRSLEKTWDSAFKKSLDTLHINFEEQ